MNINLIRLSNDINKDSESKKYGNNFIEDLNNSLFEDDFFLTEKCNNAIFDIVLVETGGTENKYLDILPTLKEPILLLSHGFFNSLPACFEIQSYLIQHKKQVILLNGKEKDLAGIISVFGKAFTLLKNLENTNLGVIGKPSDWLIASNVDYKKVYDYFKINLIDISISELEDEINKNKFENSYRLKSILSSNPHNKTLIQSLYIYSGIRRLVNKYNLKGLTIRCFDLLSIYKNTACLALAMLNEEGIVSACEGDIPTLLTMYMISVLTGRSGFQANPSDVDLQHDKILLAHCTAPLNMLEKYEFDTHFESGLGIAIKGDLLKQEVDIVKIHPQLNGVLVIHGTIEENLKHKCYCRTQVVIKTESENLFSLYSHPFGNHLVLSYDRVGDIIVNAVSIVEDRNKKKVKK